MVYLTRDELITTLPASISYRTHGFVRTISDLCLFMKITAPDRRVYAWVHVDDTLIAADRLKDIEAF